MILVESAEKVSFEVQIPVQFSHKKSINVETKNKILDFINNARICIFKNYYNVLCDIVKNNKVKLDVDTNNSNELNTILLKTRDIIKQFDAEHKDFAPYTIKTESNEEDIKKNLSNFNISKSSNEEKEIYRFVLPNNNYFAISIKTIVKNSSENTNKEIYCVFTSNYNEYNGEGYGNTNTTLKKFHNNVYNTLHKNSVPTLKRIFNDTSKKVKIKGNTDKTFVIPTSDIDKEHFKTRRVVIKSNIDDSNFRMLYHIILKKLNNNFKCNTTMNTNINNLMYYILLKQDDYNNKPDIFNTKYDTICCVMFFKEIKKDKKNKEHEEYSIVLKNIPNNYTNGKTFNTYNEIIECIKNTNGERKIKEEKLPEEDMKIQGILETIWNTAITAWNTTVNKFSSNASKRETALSSYDRSYNCPRCKSKSCVYPLDISSTKLTESDILRCGVCGEEYNVGDVL